MCEGLKDEALLLALVVLSLSLSAVHTEAKLISRLTDQYLSLKASWAHRSSGKWS